MRILFQIYENFFLRIFASYVRINTQKLETMRKAIVIAVLAVLVTVTMIIWFIRSGATLDLTGSSIMIIQFVVLAFAIVVVFRRLKSAK